LYFIRKSFNFFQLDYLGYADNLNIVVL